MKTFKVEFLRSTKFLASILITTTLLIHFQSFFYELIFLDDDLLVYERFQDTNFESKITESFTSNYLSGHYYRPVTLLSFIIDSELSGNSLFTYHFTNFIFHLLTVLTLFIALLEIGYSRIVAFVSSMFFALNPININAIGWIAGRGDLMTALFTLLGLFFFHKFINRIQSAFLLIVIVALLLAILSKEAALAAPFLFVAFFFMERKDFSLNKTNIASLLMIPIVLISYYILRGLLSDVYIDKFSFTTFYKNIMVLPETISKFFILIGIKALPGIEPFTSISGTIILLVLVILPFIFKKIIRLRYYFGLVWFVLFLLPGMVFRTMVQDGFFYWDCRSYLPLIGLIITFAELLRSLELSEYFKLSVSVAIVYLILFAFSSFQMIKFYKNADSYWGSVKLDYPNSYLPYVGLFNYYNQKGIYEEAENQLLLAIKLRPEESTLRQMLINYYQKNNQKKQALNILKESVLDESYKSDFYLEKFISLCTETNQPDGIDRLIKKYSGERIVLKKINGILSVKAKEYETKGDKINATKLTEKITTQVK